MIPLDQLGILRKNPAKLNGGHILMTFSAQKKRVVIFPDGVIDSLQFISVCLKSANILRRKISCGLKILADHPFTERGNHLACFKIHKPQKISCPDVSFIINKALFQTGNRP